MRKAGALLAALSASALLSGCGTFEAACPSIAQAPGVSLTVAAGYAGAVQGLSMKACQDGACKAGKLELVPGTTSVDQGCSPAVEAPGGYGYGPDSVCSATSRPDGTRRGILHLPALTESPMDVTVSGTLSNGRPLPARTLRFTPDGNYPFGEQCGRFITASVVLDGSGLREDAAAS
jgi:hypothetical protein